MANRTYRSCRVCPVLSSYFTIFRAKRTEGTLIMVGDMSPGELAKADQDVASTRALIDSMVVDAVTYQGEPFDGRGVLIHRVAGIDDMVLLLNGNHQGTHALVVELVLCLAEARGLVKR